jgi:hypothetical protein
LHSVDTPMIEEAHVEPGLHSIDTPIIEEPIVEEPLPPRVQSHSRIQPGPIVDTISDPGPNPHSKLFCLRELLRKELSGATPAKITRAKMPDRIDRIDVRLDAIIDSDAEADVEESWCLPSVVELIEEANTLCKRQRQRERHLSWSLAGGVALGVALVIGLLLAVGPTSDPNDQKKLGTSKGIVSGATALKREAVSAAEEAAREKGIAASRQNGSEPAAGTGKAPASSPRGAGAGLSSGNKVANAVKSKQLAKHRSKRVSKSKKHQRVRRRWAHARKRWRAKRRKARRLALLSRRKLDQHLLRNPYP